ncbi:MAG: HD domain-containing protein [Candidatus Helarchaeota archaeon]
MGGGGGGYYIGGHSGYDESESKDYKSQIDEIAKKIKEKSQLTKLKNEEKNIKEFLKKEMEKAADYVPWDHNDHSIKHVERVLTNIPDLIKNLENISFSKEFLRGETLSDIDKEILKYSVILHDIGRCDPDTKNHALSSKNYIEQINRGIDSKITKEIALLAQLHTPSGIKKLGGKSLSDLVKKGIIDKKQAYLASILTIGDALDAGKARVQYNTQGESATKVIDKIKKKYSEGIATSKLQHWYGHQGFSNTKLIKENGNLKLKINLDIKVAEKNSTAIAFRVFDIIKDITTSYLPNSNKFKLDLRITSRNIEKARDWYNENKLIFGSEKKISNIEFEEIR